MTMSKTKKIITAAVSVEGDKTLLSHFTAEHKIPPAPSFSPGAGGGFAMTPILRAEPK
jgi:hypothetical protein